MNECTNWAVAQHGWLTNLNKQIRNLDTLIEQGSLIGGSLHQEMAYI